MAAGGITTRLYVQGDESRDSGSRAYEQFIAGQAAQAPSGTFGDFSQQQISNFYLAKVADNNFMSGLLTNETSVNEFLSSAVSFCRFVQAQTFSTYTNATNSLGSDELAARQRNLDKVWN